MAATPQGTTVDVTRVREFAQDVHVEAQQMLSRIRDKADIKMVDAKDFAYDGLGTVEAVDANARYAELDFADLEHKRRQIVPNRYQCTLPIDGKDKIESVFDVENQYAKHIAAAMVRQFDRVGMTALTADINTGENFQTPLTAAADGVVTIDATPGLTYDTLLEIDENFINQDLGIGSENFMKWFAISGKEHTSLMKEIELISGDFSRDYNVEKGRIQRAAGFELVKYAAGATNPVLTEAAARSCVAWTEGALCYAMQQDFEVEVRKLPNFVNVHAVIITATFGAVRTEGARVVQVNTAL